jgi:hypothetical protein
MLKALEAEAPFLSVQHGELLDVGEHGRGRKVFAVQVSDSGGHHQEEDDPARRAVMAALPKNLSLSKSAQRLGRGRLGGGGGGGGGVLSSSKSVHFTGGVQGLYACATGGEEAPATPRVWRGSLTIPSVARACSLATVVWRARVAHP